MRVVIDTNIWISGLLWRGLPWKLLRLAESKRVEICASPEMLAVLAEVLSYDRLQPRIEELRIVPADVVMYAMGLASVIDVPAGAPIRVWSGVKDSDRMPWLLSRLDSRINVRRWV